MKPKSRRKLSVLQRQNFACYWCGKHIDLTSATREHIIPRSRGGGDGDENIAMACFKCNQLKGNQTPEEFIRDILGVFHRFMKSEGFQNHRRTP